MIEKKNQIEIIPENAEFEELRSLGDESEYEDVGENNGASERREQTEQIEQEEISRKRKSGSLETQESTQPYQ
ncbi:hypothetical protein AgCh_032812 [Apium graveolens]